MDDVWCMREVVTYVTERGCKRVTLQFPDDMLEDAPTVAQALQRELSACSDAKVSVSLLYQSRATGPCSPGAPCRPAQGAHRAAAFAHRGRPTAGDRALDAQLER